MESEVGSFFFLFCFFFIGRRKGKRMLWPLMERGGITRTVRVSPRSAAFFRGLQSSHHVSHRTLNFQENGGGTGRRWMSVEGAESEEDHHEIMFYSMRHAATVTLKEMHHFGAQVRALSRRPPST